VARTLGEVDDDATALLWVTDFPMFEWCAVALVVGRALDKCAHSTRLELDSSSIC
jgi:hypothetical protein